MFDNSHNSNFSNRNSPAIVIFDAKNREITSNMETPISNFTLAELMEQAGDNRHGLMRECIVIDNETTHRPFYLPCRIDAFIIGIGTEGAISIDMNLHRYTINRNSLFVFTPKNIMQCTSDGHFKAHVMAVSPKLLRTINIDTQQLLPLFMQFAEHPCIDLPEQESRELHRFIALIGQEIQENETDFTRKIVCELITATVYKIGDILHRYLSEHPETDVRTHNRAEEYFKQFIELLGESYKQERSVGFYANKLCITPKYLTTLIKRISGKSVSDWIDNYVILEAKSLLRFSGMSIQEIAYYLNFPNQSFFGSYFKRITGMSPSQYKEQER